MNTKKIRYAKETLTVDHQSGEVFSQELVTTSEVEKEPEYVKLYITDMMKLTGIPKSASSILMSLLRYVNFNNQIVLVKPIKEEISRELNISMETLKKALQLFIDKGILSRADRGVYVTNPFFFARGSWQHIRKIRLMVEYTEKGRFIIKKESADDSTTEALQDKGGYMSGVELKADGRVSNKEITFPIDNDDY